MEGKLLKEHAHMHAHTCTDTHSHTASLSFFVCLSAAYVQHAIPLLSCLFVFVFLPDSSINLCTVS